MPSQAYAADENENAQSAPAMISFFITNLRLERELDERPLV
jgi:hypothetical protein